MADTVIGPDEILVGRAFTDPEFTRRGAEVMRAMLTREREYAQAWRGRHAGEQIVRDHDDDNHRHFLVKGAYGNLVLFSTPDGPKKWSTDAVHRRAVAVSPEHYFDVRLHRGSVAGGLLDGGELAIASTRYLDFTGPTTWQGVRRWPAP